MATGWKTVGLRDVAEVTAGDPAPQGAQFFESGRYPFVRTQDVGRLHVHPALSDTIDRVNDLAVNQRRLRLWPQGVLLIPKSGASTFLNHRVLTAAPACVASHLAIVAPGSEVLPEYLYFWSLTVDSRRIAPDNNYPSLRLSDLGTLQLPLPPLPVQERIVQILQKADEIRRKCHEALDLADSILPAAYRYLFGDPESNPLNWPIEPLAKYLRETRYGTSEKASAHGDGDPVLRIPNVVNGTIETEGLKYLIVSDAERQRLLLRRGDILVIRTNGNKDYVGRCAVFDLEETYIFASYLIRLRVQQERLEPHYVAAFLSTPCGRRQIDANSKTSAGQYNISSSGLQAIRIPVPPLTRQLSFLNHFDRWREVKARLDSGLREANATFTGLLARALSGELTAEWEAANAEWITAQTELQERLPRLVLLELIYRGTAGVGDKAAQAAITATTLLMKYMFLIQMEGRGRRRLYDFAPHRCGPFARCLYADLEKLQKEGLITLDNKPGDSETHTTLTDPIAAGAALADLPDDLREDATAILDTCGKLDHDALLAAIRERYPAYVKKESSTEHAGRRSKGGRAGEQG